MDEQSEAEKIEQKIYDKQRKKLQEASPIPVVPFHQPTAKTRLMVSEFYAAGVPRTRIAYYLDIDDCTLDRMYKEELDFNLDVLNKTLTKSLYRDALAGDKASREFWLKCRAGWHYARPPEDDKRIGLVDTLLERVIDKL